MDAPLSVKRWRQSYANPTPWYRDRNAKIYVQAQTMDPQEIADYWRLCTKTITEILTAEIRRRGENG